MAALAVAAAACSSPSTTPPTTSTTGATPPTTSSTPPTTAATTGTPTCAASGLSIIKSGSQGAAGTFELTFSLRNSSSATCVMDGYPGAQLLTATGTSLTTTVVRGGSYTFSDFPPAPVTLVPGATAYLNLAYNDVPTGSGPCPTAGQIEITPPNATDHQTLTLQIMACNQGTLTVSPVFAASSSETQTTAPAGG